MSVIVPACFTNPLREKAVGFLRGVLAQEVRARIPVSAVLGAYHIATRYLRAPRALVCQVLTAMLEMGSPAFFPDISPRLAMEALELAASFRIESWDGYLVAVARLIGAGTIYSLDKSLERVPGVRVVSPFTEEELREYHEFILSRRKRQR